MGTECVARGAGIVVESRSPAVPRGADVEFIAPLFVEDESIQILHEAFVRVVETPHVSRREEYALGPQARSAIDEIAGWSPYSGAAVPIEPLHILFAELERSPSVPAALCAAPRRSAVSATGFAMTGNVEHTGRPRRVVVGCGNYVRTVVLPYLGRYTDVVGIVDLDSRRLRDLPEGVRFVARDYERVPEDEFDAVVAAGYHNSHAEVLLWAWEKSRPCIVEKPLATTKERLEAVAKVAAEGTGHKLFVAYQRRHGAFARYLQEDLPRATPVDYFATVFEEPLPRNHWYRWPSVGSGIVSNGCHWLDHFLWINRSSNFKSLNVGMVGETTHLVGQLDTGATVTLVLTSVGSSRLGVRDHVELRAADTTVTITDNSRYVAETSNRIIRRSIRPRLHAHRAMYSNFGQRLAAGGPSDDLEHELRSAKAVLDAEAQIRAP